MMQKTEFQDGKALDLIIRGDITIFNRNYNDYERGAKEQNRRKRENPRSDAKSNEPGKKDQKKLGQGGTKTTTVRQERLIR